MTVTSNRIALTLKNDLAEIEDDGRPFNPLETPPPNVGASLPEKPIGGLGIHLAKTMMDSMAYRREAEKNILTIRKKIAIDQRR
jgi:serine/threonine-protein kinase RsbW